MSELTKRILFAVPAAAFAIWVTWMGRFYFYVPLFVIVMLIQHEIQQIATKAGFQPARFFQYIMASWVMLTPILPLFFEIGIALFLIFIALQVLNTAKDHLQHFFVTFFCAGYASFGLLFLYLIRSTGPNKTGFVLTITFLLMVWGNDVFAYFGGKNFGKNMLAPSLSPSKTWEGFFSGFIGAAVAIALVWVTFPAALPFSWWVLVPSIIAISIFAPLGDLAESKLKRAADVKDASRLLPGHGGVFDRFDGVILAAPAFYLYLRCLQELGYAVV